METQPFRVLEPLRHDGVDYAPGGMVVLAIATAPPLVVSGVITTLPPASPAGDGQAEGVATAPPRATRPKRPPSPA